MQIHRNGSGPTTKAPESSFTGDVRISGYFQREAPSRLAGATATFAPGARTPWKVNPCGQTLVVTSGVGWAQGEGEAIVEIRAGDVVWCPPGRRHWEGATPDQAMTYVAVHEHTVEFTQSVTDEEYSGGPRALPDPTTRARRRAPSVDDERAGAAPGSTGPVVAGCPPSGDVSR